jgi:hypothetical protein
LLAKTINHPNALLIHTLSKPDQTKMWNLIKTIVMLKFQLIIHATDELHPFVMFELKLPETIRPHPTQIMVGRDQKMWVDKLEDDPMMNSQVILIKKIIKME